MNINVEYDGSYPNRCSGQLIVEIDGTTWTFPPHCMGSGGSVSFDNNWNENVEEGEWGIGEWPKDFPEEYKEAVLREVNKTIPRGCCGGCV